MTDPGPGSMGGSGLWNQQGVVVGVVVGASTTYTRTTRRDD